MSRPAAHPRGARMQEGCNKHLVLHQLFRVGRFTQTRRLGECVVVCMTSLILTFGMTPSDVRTWFRVVTLPGSPLRGFGVRASILEVGCPKIFSCIVRFPRMGKNSKKPVTGFTVFGPDISFNHFKRSRSYHYHQSLSTQPCSNCTTSS